MVVGSAVLACGCSGHGHRARASLCPSPAPVVGAEDGGGYQGGWVVVRKEVSAQDAAARIGATYHVRTQPLLYVHGFSVFPMPEGAKLRCDKAVMEVHFDPAQQSAAR